MKKFIICFALFLLTTTQITPHSWGFIIKDIYSFSEDNLISWIKIYDVKNPGVVLRQAKLETGYYTSNIFKENNNLFGMKLAKVRETVAIGENRNHAKYENWIKSVYDYKLWQDYHKIDSLSNEEYYKLLNRYGYSESGDYVKCLKLIE